MKKSFLVFMIIMLLLLGGCSSLDLDKVKEFSDPMVEEMLQALNRDDYDAFTANFGPEMLAAIDEDAYNTSFKADTVDIIGEYQSKELIKASKTKSNGKEFIQAIYQAKYSNEEEDVVVTVFFSDDPDNRTIDGLYFNSPKIVESSQ